MNPSRLVALVGLWCAAVPAALPAQRPAMKLDQANTATWQNAWTNLLNDVRQSFIPSLPKLVAVEVELVLANPGTSADTLTMKLTQLGVSLQLCRRCCRPPTLSMRYLSFRKVSPGQLYSLQPFGWKYVVGGYRKGSASFNGQALLREIQAHSYSRHSARRRPSFLSAHTSFAAFNPSL